MHLLFYALVCLVEGVAVLLLAFRALFWVFFLLFENVGRAARIDFENIFGVLICSTDSPMC